MRIINFGSLNIDKVYQVEQFVRPGQTITAKDYAVAAGGKGLNQSLAAARAGAEVLHAGAIGAEGRFMADLLRESGADTSLLREVDGPSGHAVIEINAAGQNRIIVFGGANRRETREYIERVLDTAQPDDWVLLQNEVNLVPEIICRAHEKELRVVFNPSPVPENTEKLPLACVSLFMVNEIEAAQLAGTDANADFEDTLTALRAKYPNASVVMTVGADGVLYDGEEGRFQLPAFKVGRGHHRCRRYLLRILSCGGQRREIGADRAAGGFGGIRSRSLAHRRGSLGADSRRSTGISAQARINHRKRGKLNLRKECIGMHITIERDGCISCGLCEGTCPSVFRIAEDGLAEVHHQPETAEEQAGAQEAAGGCPVAVIHVS